MVDTILKEIKNLEYELEHSVMSSEERQLKIELLKNKKREVESESRKEPCIIPGTAPLIKDRKKEICSIYSENRVMI